MLGDFPHPYFVSHLQSFDTCQPNWKNWKLGLQIAILDTSLNLFSVLYDHTKAATLYRPPHTAIPFGGFQPSASPRMAGRWTTKGTYTIWRAEQVVQRGGRNATTMITHEKKLFPEARQWWLRRWTECWDQPSETARHYYHVLLATIMFFLAQIITFAWNQPFWSYGLNFPGQIVAMVFVWLAMWAIQAILFKPGEGLEKVYNDHVRAPVSSSA